MQCWHYYNNVKHRRHNLHGSDEQPSQLFKITTVVFIYDSIAAYRAHEANVRNIKAWL
jgi:hypothetical protein